MHIIRHSEKKDIEQIRQLYAEPSNYSATLQGPYPAAELWEARLGQSHTGAISLVAVSGEEVLGQLGLHIEQNPRRKHVADIGMAVKTSARRQGVADALMRAAIEIAEQWQAISRIELSVYTDNLAALALYEKHGFIKEGLCKNYAFRNGQFTDVFIMARCKTT
ncbi:GNAT family N-acetyltransferase [Iodobacter fluviatilis]|uniref:Acetyltransferase n=1 Tax=Iodobacter fluviatilis TaxID=537 RepID=A0A377Q9S4_9NEIS|nr:GNAT family N-acetyltransferase [Iodobacter fluviatilis]TCU81890.1 putative acetyltransferase [Iodobacter fluviatilis]STQ91577.1 putative acetyltransferase YhhY [Iodobacter fluviatilis]